MPTKTIDVKYLARVEGEGALHVRLRGSEVQDVQLRIFEPPRFFEAMLRGRSCHEAADITARICGICPVAYQMSAVHAVERAMGVRVDGPLRDLRRLLYCGEWIESHALHVFMLHAPDFLGYRDAIRMAADHRARLEAGLRIKKAGNLVVRVIGGREIHPVNVRTGGFFRVPRRDELRPLAAPLAEAAALAEEAAAWVAGFPFPDVERDYELVALAHPSEYAMTEGRIVSSRGLDIDPAAFDEHFEELHVPYTSALQGVRKGGGSYLTGPLARYALSYDRLGDRARAVARRSGLGRECRNPFRSIIVRCVEIVQACDEATRLVAGYREPARAALPVPVRAAAGAAATEAPRGLLFHRYAIDAAGLIEDARIVPPTAQNQRSIEDDLRSLLPKEAWRPQRELARFCERAIRNHDPCISCATHFLDLTVEQVEGGAR